ncbi:conjugative transposon protein TraK [Dyadobacter luteus]|uniref:Conjugative transposon protein TraK n=1 Tax=Dyadobacter luteus TaxID=2259619 RepID=A0A3D8Y264_9BACT|nr:conjugative transposon protein TraK [Dyadobacter luteus]REA55061.1 conjugative transposon protein TraK [Dyadobacter luteus]
MFQKAKNLDTAFRQIRTFTLCVIGSCVLICTLVVYQSHKSIQIAQSRVYILESGKILEAFASQRSENIGVEARDHIANFHRLFFSLDPDEKAIQTTISKALYLADASAKHQYDNLRESGYYTGVISGNVSQQIQIDTVQINTASYPYQFSCQAVQRIIRPTSIVNRRLITQGVLRSVSRSDHNPHGFLIERWQITENSDINMQIR